MKNSHVLSNLLNEINNSSVSSNKKLFENESIKTSSVNNSSNNNNNNNNNLINNYKSDLILSKNQNKNSLISINSSFIKNIKNFNNNLANNHNNNHFHHKDTIQKLTVITIDEAENGIKNLLSGFLNNVDEDDKKKFGVDDEIKRIKFSHHNNNDSHSSSSSGFEDYAKNYRKKSSVNKNKILKKKSRKKGVDFFLDYEKKNSFNKNFQRLMTSDIILKRRKNSKNYDNNYIELNNSDGKKNNINKSKSFKYRNSQNFNKKLLLKEKFERLNSNISEDFTVTKPKKRNIKFILDDDHSITSKSKKKTFKSKNSRYLEEPEREQEILLKANTRGSNLSRNSSITKSIFNFKQTLSFKKRNSFYTSNSFKFEGKKSFGENNKKKHNQKYNRNKLRRHLTIDHNNNENKNNYNLKLIKQKLNESIILNNIKKDKEFIDFNKNNSESKNLKRRNSLIQKNNLLFHNLFNNLNNNLSNENNFLSKNFFNYNENNSSKDKKILKSLKKTIIAGLEENDKDLFKKINEENNNNINNNNNNVNNDNNNNNNNILNKASFKQKNSFNKKNSLNINKKNSNTIIKKHSSNKKLSNEDDKSDIRNFIPLSKQNYNKFNNLCDNLKNSLIMANSKNLLLNSSEKKESKKSITDYSKNENISKKNSFLKEKLEINSEHYKKKLIKEFQFRRLTRQNKLVYDSLSDEESLEEIEGEFYLNPKDKIKIIFDSFICFACLYNAIYPPIILAFHTFDSNKLNLINFIIDLFIDCLHIFDFFLGFITGFYDFEEYFITNNRFMFNHYLTSWCLFDFLTGFPINSIFNILKKKK